VGCVQDSYYNIDVPVVFVPPPSSIASSSSIIPVSSSTLIIEPVISSSSEISSSSIIPVSVIAVTWDQSLVVDHNVPGIIQAEDYLPPQYPAPFWESDPTTNKGGVTHRRNPNPGGVDMESNNQPSGKHVSHFDAGEALSYRLVVTAGRTYQVSMNYARTRADNTPPEVPVVIYIYDPRNNFIDFVAMDTLWAPATAAGPAGWGTFRLSQSKNLKLDPGTWIMTVEPLVGNVNLDYIRFQ
jgi:hypothetical protein